MTLLLLLFVSLTLMAVPVTSDAQAPFHWSTPEQIPEYNNLLFPPLMIADRNWTVHAFNMETLEGNTAAVLYRRWSLEQGWSHPVDIIIPIYMGVAPDLLDVDLDDRGIFHLLYFAGTQQASAIYYTRALASDAEDSRAWLEPIPISTDAGPLASAQLIDVGSDKIVVVFAGERYGSGIYEIQSDDQGESWSTPRLVQRSHEVELNPGGIRLALDPEGRVHAVWHLDNISGLAEETWYARLSHDLSTWEFVQKLAQKDNEIEFNGQPSIVLVEDDLLVVYYDSFPPTRFVRRSTDGGETWSSPVRPFPHQGGYGHASLVKDSQGTVHIVLGNRLQNPEIHGMWYGRLVGTAWLPLTPIISGPKINDFDPTRPEAVVVQGNILLAAWSNDVNLEHRAGAWYSYAFLDAPELAIELLSTRDPELSHPPADHLIPPASPSPTPSQRSYPDPQQDMGSLLASPRINPGSAIFIGATSVVIILLIVFFNRSIQER